MWRFILIGVLVAILWQLFKRTSQENISRASKEAPPSADMVRCVVCQLHLPKVEAIEKDAVFYCCNDHAQRKA